MAIDPFRTLLFGSRSDLIEHYIIAFMSLQKKYLQSHESFKHRSVYSKNTIQSYTSIQSKPNVQFAPDLILKNTQYMTHLQNYMNFKCSYTEVQYEYLFEGINPAALCKIIVQDIYLMQICYLFKIKIYLSVNLYTDKGKYIPSTPNLPIFQLYCFENQITQKHDGLKMKMAVLQNRFIKVFDNEKNRIDDFFLVLDLMSKHISQYLSCCEKTQKPQSSNSEISQNRKLLSQFLKIYEDIILGRKSRVSEPKCLIKFLQHSKLFRKHSMLVKIVNNTLFYSMKLFSRDLVQHLKHSTSELQKYFMYKGGQAKFQKQVVKIIDQFFTRLCLLNVIEITKSLKGMDEESEMKTMEALSLFDYDPIVTHPLTITASIIVPEHRGLTMGSQLFEQIIGNGSGQNKMKKQEDQAKNIEIEISYTYSTNLTLIKCITDIDVGVDNMDYMNYLMSAFNEGLKSTLVVDTIEKFRRSMTKKIEKVVAFKLVFNGKPNSEPLTKILELIDVGILASKIFTAELGRKSFVKLEDYDKREKVCEMFSHYENIFRNLIRKFYGELKPEL